MMLDTRTRWSIAFDYWFSIALALFFIIKGTADAGWATPDIATFFIATFFIIHAHGNRIRNTLIALHTKDSS